MCVTFVRPTNRFHLRLCLCWWTSFAGLREKNKVGREAAKAFAVATLDDPSLPHKVRWRVVKELAQIAKREHHYNKARALYAEVNRLAPHRHVKAIAKPVERGRIAKPTC